MKFARIIVLAASLFQTAPCQKQPITSRFAQQLRACPFRIAVAMALLALPCCGLLCAAGTSLAAEGGASTTESSWKTVNLPPRHATIQGIEVDIALASSAEIQALRDISPMGTVALGLVSVPLSVLNPFYGLGIAYAFVGPPMSASFQAKLGALDQAMMKEPLPQRIEEALHRQVVPEALALPLRIDLRLASYGLVARSVGPSVFAQDSEMCLVAHVLLVASRAGREILREPISVDITGRSLDIPPPICDSFSRFAANDGMYLRQAIRELAEILAAATLTRLESRP